MQQLLMALGVHYKSFRSPLLAAVCWDLMGELDRACRTYQAFIARYSDNGVAVTATRNLEECRRRLLEASEPILIHQTQYHPRRNHP